MAALFPGSRGVTDIRSLPLPSVPPLLETAGAPASPPLGPASPQPPPTPPLLCRQSALRPAAAVGSTPVPGRAAVTSLPPLEPPPPLLPPSSEVAAAAAAAAAAAEGLFGATSPRRRADGGRSSLGCCICGHVRIGESEGVPEIAECWPEEVGRSGKCGVPQLDILGPILSRAQAEGVVMEGPGVWGGFREFGVRPDWWGTVSEPNGPVFDLVRACLGEDY